MGLFSIFLVGSEHFWMVPPASDSHDHHGHGHGHVHVHVHSHGPTSPHPAQAAPWSILRMTVVSRLAAACAVSVALWAAVWLATR
jgi:hypothetical protein